MEWNINNVEIVKLYKSDTNKDGKPFMSSKGNHFSKVDIYIDPREIDDPDFQGKMSYFDYYGNMENYGQGQSITGTVVKNGKYFNFNFPPSGKKALELEIKELKDSVKELQEAVFGQERATKEIEVKKAIGFSKALLEDNSDRPDNEDVDDLPF